MDPQDTISAKKRVSQGGSEKRNLRHEIDVWNLDLAEGFPLSEPPRYLFLEEAGILGAPVGWTPRIANSSMLKPDISKGCKKGLQTSICNIEHAVLQHLRRTLFFGHCRENRPKLTIKGSEWVSGALDPTVVQEISR